MKKGFTLLELIVVIIIIGVLGSLGFAQYTKMVEKGRTVEAKTILGSIRGAEEAYRLEYGKFTTDSSLLAVEVTPGSCTAAYYYSYKVESASDSDFLAKATRCTSGGKIPDSTKSYDITVDAKGAFSGTKGMY